MSMLMTMSQRSRFSSTIMIMTPGTMAISTSPPITLITIWPGADTGVLTIIGGPGAGRITGIMTPGVPGIAMDAFTAGTRGTTITTDITGGTGAVTTTVTGIIMTAETIAAVILSAVGHSPVRVLAAGPGWAKKVGTVGGGLRLTANGSWRRAADVRPM